MEAHAESAGSRDSRLGQRPDYGRRLTSTVIKIAWANHLLHFREIRRLRLG
jgi:hypothetical protein